MKIYFLCHIKIENHKIQWLISSAQPKIVQAYTNINSNSYTCTPNTYIHTQKYRWPIKRTTQMVKWSRCDDCKFSYLLHCKRNRFMYIFIKMVHQKGYHTNKFCLTATYGPPISATHATTATIRHLIDIEKDNTRYNKRIN